jgi:bifunctional DNA-binding transcriptional regulator/antitoxin component of YhaV-PrlF toxin-antitoxin module
MAVLYKSRVVAMKHTSSLANGRAVIPSALRAQLNLKDGDQLIWSIRGEELMVTTRRAQLQNAQATFQRKLKSSAPSLADELIAQRRAENVADKP